jgi:hypothetical protein
LLSSGPRSGTVRGPKHDLAGADTHGGDRSCGVAGIEFPFGRPLGLPDDRAGQRTVLQAALEVLVAAREPGTVVQLPFRWPQDPREAGGDPPVPPPIVQLLKRKPCWRCGCWPTTSQHPSSPRQPEPTRREGRFSHCHGLQAGGLINRSSPPAGCVPTWARPRLGPAFCRRRLGGNLSLPWLPCRVMHWAAERTRRSLCPDQVRR